MTEYEFLRAQKTFYCTPTPALEPLMRRVCFLHELPSKKKKKKSIPGPDFASSVIAPPCVVRLPPLEMAPSAVEQLTRG